MSQRFASDDYYDRSEANTLDESDDFSRSELFEADLEEGDGLDPDFINASVIHQTQEYKDAIENIRQLKARLARRSRIIEEIRKYYLKDVVTVKHVLRDVLTEPERDAVLQTYYNRLPSLDMRQGLALHAPSKTELQVKPCEECGGVLEIVMKDNDEVYKLKKQLADVRERDGRWRVKLATLDAQIESVGKERAETTKSHFEEVSR